MLTFAKAILALFWLLALANLVHPFAGPYMSWVALLLLVIHAAEILLLHGRLQRQSKPWLARLLVLLFGVLHVRGMRETT